MKNPSRGFVAAALCEHIRPQASSAPPPMKTVQTTKLSRLTHPATPAVVRHHSLYLTPTPAAENTCQAATFAISP